MKKYLEPKEEALLMQKLFSTWAECYQIVNNHFNVLQARNQMMLALATLTLTITGFSGPKIAADNPISRILLVVGLVTVLFSTVIILLSTLRIKWLTQTGIEEPTEILVSLIEKRNRRTRAFHIQLVFLVGGLFSYVAGVIVYFMIGRL